MTAVGLYNSLFRTRSAVGSGQAGTTATAEAGASDFIAQLQQAALDEAAPAAKIKATATALTGGTPATTSYTAIPATAPVQTTAKSVASVGGVARQIASLMPASGQTSFDAQTIAQQPASDTATTGTPTASDQFMQFARQSPVERLRGQILGGMGLTQQQVTQMAPTQQSKVEATVREKIRETMKKDMGVASASAPQGAAAADILASA